MDSKARIINLVTPVNLLEILIGSPKVEFQVIERACLRLGYAETKDWMKGQPKRDPDSKLESHVNY